MKQELKEEKGGMSGYITLRGVRVHNLKNIDVRIPRGKFVVITGVSGSGKSSLAFDTLYAEGQRRYVESLSAYARQFLGGMSKPAVDFISGIPPAIAIEQKVNTRNPRSTVGTSTEIYDYMKLLFARIGRTYSPVSGEEVKAHTSEDVVDYMLSLAEGTRLMLLTRLVVPQGRTWLEHLKEESRQGYGRIAIQDEVMLIDDCLEKMAGISAMPSSLRLVVDRLSVKFDAATRSRMTDSVESAMYDGQGECELWIDSEKGWKKKRFSERFEADGMTFEKPSDQMFSYNNPLGACPTCQGFGKVMGIDESLVIPEKGKSVYEDAVICWRGEVMSEWKKSFVMESERYGFPIHRPYNELTEEEKDLLWHGRPSEGLYGIDSFFDFVQQNQYKIQYRVMLARYRGKTTCPDCHGSRLKKEASYVKVGGASITDLTRKSIIELKQWFGDLKIGESGNSTSKKAGLSTSEAATAKRLLTEINRRLQILLDVGLGYLTLDRESRTLSGGESQRINLATSLGSSLVGSLYILDEPSIGLHSRDTERLIKVLRGLQQLGNTVVVVEHDEEIMRAADYIIDIGPMAGRNGGQVVYEGDLQNITAEQARESESYTLKFLTGLEQVALPQTRRKWRDYIELKGVCQNNLKNVTVKFPLGVMTAVTGVSGSGKSSLVRDALYCALRRKLGGVTERVVDCGELSGSVRLLDNVEEVDQNPIGKSSRSNPVTYLKAYDEIRKLMSEQQLSKQLGFTPAHFSLNVDGGRCEECQGAGTVTIEMQFMANLELPCEACHGTGFKSEVLEVEYRGANIRNILDMTVNQAIDFFGAEDGKFKSICQRIVSRLKPLQEVGIGYVKLGQSSDTLSGGESQRVKLASYISNDVNAVGAAGQHHTLYIFDEPTTGLHEHDIITLMKAFDRLIEQGNTIVVIEHNLDVIKCADWVIDMGPEGGEKGGNVVFAGVPEELVTEKKSITGQYIKEKIKARNRAL